MVSMLDPNDEAIAEEVLEGVRVAYKDKDALLLPVLEDTEVIVDDKVRDLVNEASPETVSALVPEQEAVAEEVLERVSVACADADALPLPVLEEDDVTVDGNVDTAVRDCISEASADTV